MQLPAITVADLLADQSFINYCKGYEADVQHWEKFLQQHPEHADTIHTAQQMFFGIFNVFAAADLEEQVEQLTNRIAEAPVVQMPLHDKKKSAWLLSIKIAAAMVLAVIGYFAWTSQQETQHTPLLTYSTQPGEKKTIQLSDGSVVMLNASSRITVTESFGTSDRTVMLTGEAFFDVKKNKALPFIVNTRSLQVRALGTAFNIKAYPGEAKCETALVRGLIEVKLHDKEGTRVMLYPSQKLEWDNDVVAKTTSSTTDSLKHNVAGQSEVIKPLFTNEEGLVKELAWIENKLIFSDETFAEIAPQLERWYGVTIEFGDRDVAAYKFTGTFEKESLKTVLDVLKESKTFHYNIMQAESQTVTILK
jgi:transmembrane sensor